MNKLTKPKLVAIVDELSKLVPSEPFCDYRPNPEIRLMIMRTSEDGTPRNYSHNFGEIDNSAGGCSCRIWSYKTEGVFSMYGPSVSLGDSRDYKRALKGTLGVELAMEKMYKERGSPGSACESLSRWLEACKVSSIMMRPEGSKNESWLSKGEWTSLTIGSFIARCRTLMPDSVQPE